MIPIRFQRKMLKWGNSYIFIIPMAFAKVMDEDKEYTIRVEEVENKRGKQNEKHK